RGLDDADERPFGQLGRGHRLPGTAAIPREMHEAVIRAGPQHVALVRRLDEGEDRAVDLGAGVVAGDGAARGAHLARVVAGEILAHDLPRVPLVGGAEDEIAGDPELARIPAGVEDGERPLEAVAMLAGRRAHAVALGPHADDALLAGAVIVVDHPPHAGAAPDGAPHHDVRIARLDGDIAALASARLHPVDRGDGAAMGLAGHADGPVVLLRAVDAVRPLIVRADVVELRGRLIVDGRPR